MTRRKKAHVWTRSIVRKDPCVTRELSIDKQTFVTIKKTRSIEMLQGELWRETSCGLFLQWSVHTQSPIALTNCLRCDESKCWPNDWSSTVKITRDLDVFLMDIFLSDRIAGEEKKNNRGNPRARDLCNQNDTRRSNIYWWQHWITKKFVCTRRASNTWINFCSTLLLME